MTRGFSEYEATDKFALRAALLTLHTCPNCRDDLQPMPGQSHVWACDRCDASWSVPDAPACQTHCVKSPGHSGPCVRVAPPELTAVPPCRNCGQVPETYARFADGSVQHLTGGCR